MWTETVSVNNVSEKAGWESRHLLQLFRLIDGVPPEAVDGNHAACCHN